MAHSSTCIDSSLPPTIWVPPIRQAARGAGALDASLHASALIPGTLVVNVGDLLGRWTNDRYASTSHRVVNRSGRERFSIATFYDPDFKAPVDPRHLGTPDAECRYEAIAAGEHILGRIERSFGYRKTLTPAA